LCASAISAAASSSSASTSAASAPAGFGGSSAQENWSSRLKGSATWNQLSIAPVGQGLTQSMQALHLPGSTT
jgi:hypothetical protein